MAAAGATQIYPIIFNATNSKSYYSGAKFKNFSYSCITKTPLSLFLSHLTNQVTPLPPPVTPLPPLVTPLNPSLFSLLRSEFGFVGCDWVFFCVCSYGFGGYGFGGYGGGMVFDFFFFPVGLMAVVVVTVVVLAMGLVAMVVVRCFIFIIIFFCEFGGCGGSDGVVWFFNFLFSGFGGCGGDGGCGGGLVTMMVVWFFLFCLWVWLCLCW
ncbi:hypothetical protein ACJW31_07G008400 [Castanea mollissima]